MAGERLPILWQWLAFTPQAKQSEIGEDGHRITGEFLPPTGDRRRMYAGGRASITGEVRIAEPLQRTSAVSDVAEKQGKSGALLFVTVDHEISALEGGILEQNDIVYKEQRPQNIRPQNARPQNARPQNAAAIDPRLLTDAEWTWGRTFLIDPVVLFRFSALTYNGHRIHYDRDYATHVEGYPGLIVHGPLQAILLADLAQRTFADRVVQSFSFRSTAPAFDDSDLELRARIDAVTGALELAAFTRDGKQSMSARATLAT